jgi:Sec20
MSADRSYVFDTSPRGKRPANRTRTPNHQGGRSNTTTSQAASIQQSLRRTQALLQNELERVSNVANAIEDDGKLLKETMHAHQTLNVSGAKKALTSLQRAQQHEHRVLLASVVFFWTVVAYILWCRVLLHIPFVDRIVPAIHGLLNIISSLSQK